MVVFTLIVLILRSISIHGIFEVRTLINIGLVFVFLNLFSILSGFGLLINGHMSNYRNANNILLLSQLMSEKKDYSYLLNAIEIKGSHHGKRDDMKYGFDGSLALSKFR